MNTLANGEDDGFWAGKRVLITGHTGFKGAWLSAVLSRKGARLAGLALPDPHRTSFAWQIAKPHLNIECDIRADIRSPADYADRIVEFKPEIVFHLAAQALVLDSYADFEGTWGANVMGSLNVFQAATLAGARSIVAITSDKCYKNKALPRGYRESDELGGRDPYSSSKAACEILIESWRLSVGEKHGIGIASCRAGNVIGGGDNAPGRILPEMMAAFAEDRPGLVRNPSFTRPFQHVLEPLSGYMLLARRLTDPMSNMQWGESYNFGPSVHGEKSVGWLADHAASCWGGGALVEKSIEPSTGQEASTLMLDSSKAMKRLGWQPKWDAGKAVELSVAWEKSRLAGNPWHCMDSQIKEYFGL